VTGRVHLSIEVPGEVPDAGPEPADATADGGAVDAVSADVVPAGCAAAARAQISGLVVPTDAIAAEHVEVRFVEPAAPAFAAVERYLVRVWEGADSSAAAFDSGTPAEPLTPLAAGGALSVHIADLKGERPYTVGVKPLGRCVDGEISYVHFTTAERKFSQLSGCFIATAAYGSPQAAGVSALRRARDAARRATPFAAATVAVYERSSPPLADLLRGTPVGRALVRQALAPLVDTVQLLGRR
jgi:hypothetical protein